MASSLLVGGVEEQKRSWLVIEPGGLGGQTVAGNSINTLKYWPPCVLCRQLVAYYTVLYWSLYYILKTEGRQ